MFIHQPIPVNLPPRTTVVAVSAGHRHSAIIDRHGRLFTFGCGLNGQLGLGDLQRRVDEPQLVRALAGEKAVSVAAGMSSTAVATMRGGVFTFGNGRDGKLGHGDQHLQLLPKAVEALSDVRITCVAGDRAFGAIDSDGNLFMWGPSEAGQCGHGTTAPTMRPRRVELQLPIVAVDCGFAHTAAIDADGGLRLWGSNRYGQLGRNKDDTAVVLRAPESHLLRDHICACSVSCGDNHTMVSVMDEKGGCLVAIFGDNTAHQLGTEAYLSLSKPKRLDALDGCPIRHVACGAQHSVVMDDEGKLMSMGDISRGQLGRVCQPLDTNIGVVRLRANETSDAIDDDCVDVTSDGSSALSPIRDRRRVQMEPNRTPPPMVTYRAYSSFVARHRPVLRAHPFPPHPTCSRPLLQTLPMTIHAERASTLRSTRSAPLA